jgi:subtilisin family serine protease
MSRVAWASIVGALLLLCPTPTTVLAECEFVPDEMLVRYHREVSSTGRIDALSRNAAKSIRQFETIGWELITVPSHLSLTQALTQFQADPAIAYTQPNYVYRDVALSDPDDTEFDKQWYLKNTGQDVGDYGEYDDCVPGADIDFVAAREDTLSGASDVLVAVLDSGIDCGHPELSPNMWTNPGETPNDKIDNDSNGYVDDLHGYDYINDDADPRSENDQHHGTTVAGLIAAVANNGAGIAGTSWHTQLMALKIMKGCTAFDVKTSDAVAAITYATDMGAQVLNASWGGMTGHCAGNDSCLYYAIKSACDEGCLFVTAAGNDGTNIDIAGFLPATYDLPCIISVGMTDCRDSIPDIGDPCPGGAKSNWGPQGVDLAAPGCMLLTTTIDPNETPPDHVYRYGSGTSGAAPLVTAAASLLWASLSRSIDAGECGPRLVSQHPDHVRGNRREGRDAQSGEGQGRRSPLSPVHAHFSTLSSEVLHVRPPGPLILLSYT